MDFLTDPEAWLAFLTLTALETVLGIDNIIFISILAGKLPGSEQAKARQIGSHQRAITANEERKIQATRLIGQLEAYLSSLQAPPPAPPPSPPRRDRPSPR